MSSHSKGFACVSKSLIQPLLQSLHTHFTFFVRAFPVLRRVELPRCSTLFSFGGFGNISLSQSGKMCSSVSGRACWQKMQRLPSLGGFFGFPMEDQCEGR